MEVAVLGLHKRFCDEKLFERVYECIQNLGFESCNITSLMTCNRIEIYISEGSVLERHPELIERIRNEFGDEIEKRFYTFLGSDVLRHLAEVAAGLDSLILGETDIQHQVKQAYENTSSVLSAEGHFLFQKALHIAKKIRTQFEIKPALSLSQHVYAKIKESLASGAKMTLMGQSELNRQILELCPKEAHSQITLISSEKPLYLSPFHPLKYKDYQSLDTLESQDILICATKAKQIEALPWVAKKGMIIDLSRPRVIRLNPEERIYLDLHYFESIQDSTKEKQRVMWEEAKRYIDENVKRLMVSRQLRLCFSTSA